MSDREDSQARATAVSGDPAATWINSLKANGQADIGLYRDAVHGFLGFVGKPIAEVTVDDVLEYAGYLSESKRSRSTISLHIAAVRAFVQHCQGVGLLTGVRPEGTNGTTVTAAWIKRRDPRGDLESILATIYGVFGSHPLGRPGRISIVMGIALPIVLWLISDDKTALNLMAFIVSMPLWVGSVRTLIYLGQWMLNEPATQARDPH